MEKVQKNQYIKTTIYVMALLLFFLGFYKMTYMEVKDKIPEDGRVDLLAADISSELYRIQNEGWEFYSGELYYPEDFISGNTAVPDYKDNTGELEFGTYRLLLKLEPGRIYAITGKSFPFSQRLFINGEMIEEVGYPAALKEETVPYSKTYVYHFIPQTETTELIFQTADFYHRQKVKNNPFVLGDPGAISQYVTRNAMEATLIIGCLITVFVYFMGMFIYASHRLHFVFMALACLILAVRLSLIGEKIFRLIFPGMSWFAAMRLEYLCHVSFVVCLFLYFNSLYPGMLPKKFVKCILGFSGIYGLIILFGGSLLFTRLLTPYTAIWVAASLVTLWKLIGQLKRRELYTILIFCGLIIFVAAAVYDEVSYLFIAQARVSNMLIWGLLICVFMNMLALTIEFTAMDAAMAVLEKQMEELDETNRMLDNLNTMKVQLLANISHEIKTPLTVISANAQLSDKLLSMKDTKEEIHQNLDAICQESQRMSRMVNNMLKLGSAQEAKSGMEWMDLGIILKQSAQTYRSLIEKKGNQIQVKIAEQMPLIYGNGDMLAQVLFNLLTNANRHTDQGEIRIDAAVTKDGKDICVTVSDNGEGIAPEFLPAVFQRWVKGQRNGEAGLGLSISKSIVERHGGAITIDSGLGSGTKVSFTLPIIKEKIKTEGRSMS